MTAAYADMLNEIGFDAELKILDGGVYFATIGNEKTADLHTGFANWFLDWPHPLNMWFIFDPDSIQPANNQNYGNVDDPKIKKELDRLNLETDLNAVADDWAALDAYRLTAAEPRGAVRAPEAGDVPLGPDGLRERRLPPGDFNDYITFALKEGAVGNRAGGRREAPPAFDCEALRADNRTAVPREDATVAAEPGTELSLGLPEELTEEERAAGLVGASPWQLALAPAAARQDRARRRRSSSSCSSLACIAAPLWAEHVAHTTPRRTTSPTRSRSTARRSNVVDFRGTPIGPTWQGEFFLGADGNGRDSWSGCSTAAATRC